MDNSLTASLSYFPITPLPPDTSVYYFSNACNSVVSAKSSKKFLALLVMFHVLLITS